MAKKSIIARNDKRERLVALYAERREQMKNDGRWEDLDKLPRNSSKVRLRNRCQLTGRPRGYVRDFGICRNQLREMALYGKIPGMKKQVGKKQNDQQMKTTDPIADFLTRIRNAQQANHRVVEIPASNLKKRMTEILYENGFIYRYKFDDNGPQGTIKIALKYDPVSKVPAIRGLERVSRPGLRHYQHVDGLPRVLSGLGMAIVSTSKGVMTEKEARRQNVGGEVLCYVY